MAASAACPVCGTPWTPIEAARAAQRAVQRLRAAMTEVADARAAGPAARGTVVGAPAPEEPAPPHPTPIDADREVWSS
jgi:hypothetical protein